MTDRDAGPAPLPAGFTFVPLSAAQAQATVRLGVILHADDAGQPPRPVLLRQLFDGRALLGALTDTAGRVLEFLEVAVQDVAGLAAAPDLAGGVNNALLDRRWAAQAKAMAAADPAGVIVTGHESAHPLPVWLDPQGREAIHPVDPESGQPLRLCTDDRDLQDAGLPPYSSTPHRYLRGGSIFIAVTEGAPTSDAVRAWADVLGADHGLVPLNPGAGLLRIARHRPVSVAALVQRLTGESTDPLPDRPRVLGPTTRRSAESAEAETPFYLSHGRSGRLVESFHLRVHLLAAAVEQVARFTAQVQRPLLNLTDASFSVGIQSAQAHLPQLWTAALHLVDGGSAVRLPLRGGVEAFVAAEAPASVYRPPVADRRTQGRAEVRLRQMIGQQDAGDLLVEGTLVSDERLDPQGRDLLYLRLPLPQRTLDVYANLSREQGMPAREWRLRTLPLPADAETRQQVRDLEGRPLDVPFALIPHLSSPADLYSLGVLGVRLLLTNREQALGVAVDELLSLGEQITEAASDDVPAARIEQVLRGQERYQQSLGPQRLTDTPLGFAAALDLVPLELWSQTLAALLTMFPGRSRLALARGLSDAAPGALHRVYGPAVEQLARLLVRSRSLIVIDWRFNREVAAVLRRVEGL